MQAQKIAAQSGFAVRGELAAVDVDGERRVRRVVRDTDNAAAILEHVLEDGVVSLGNSALALGKIFSDMGVGCIPGGGPDPKPSFGRCSS